MAGCAAGRSRHRSRAADALLPVFLPRHNARFAVPAASEVPAWRPVPAEIDLARVCAFRWRRLVGNDSCVRVEGAVLLQRCPPDPAAARSPVVGSLSSGSTAACSSWPRAACSPRWRHPRSRVGCGRSASSRPPGPSPPRTAVPSAIARARATLVAARPEGPQPTRSTDRIAEQLSCQSH